MNDKEKIAALCKALQPFADLLEEPEEYLSVSLKDEDGNGIAELWVHVDDIIKAKEAIEQAHSAGEG